MSKEVEDFIKRNAADVIRSVQKTSLFPSLPPEQELWVSLTGRNVEDHAPIMSIKSHHSIANLK